MGWWKCHPADGGIDFETAPTGAGDTKLVNAMPGRDSMEDYYNGDEPADLMITPAAMIRYWFEGKPKPSANELIAAFCAEQGQAHVLVGMEDYQFERLRCWIWKKMDVLYEENWGRPAYPEERKAICLFVFHDIDEPNAEFWTRHRSDGPLIAAYLREIEDSRG